MDSLPASACDCMRLIRILRPSDDLPDHVCLATMRATVRRSLVSDLDAIEERLSGWLNEPDGRTPAGIILSPSGAAQRRDVLFRQLAAAQTAVLKTEVPDLSLRDRRQLGFVFRQWAEEAPNATLAKLLASDPGWPRLVDEVRQITPNPIGETRLRQVLRLSQFPDSPGVARYLLACANGGTDVLPARALLVTTRFFVRILDTDSGRGLFLSGNPDIALSGGLEHAPGPLFDVARHVAFRHRDWLHRHGRDPLTVLGRVRAAQPSAWPEAEEKSAPARLDFLREALVEADWVRAKIHAGSNANNTISKHLETVSDRVRKRRIRAGLPPSGDPSWRREARRQLHALFDDPR